MFFKRRYPKEKYLNFVNSVESEYSKIGIKFDTINYPIVKHSPKENPDYYSIFSYWTANKISSLSLNGGGKFNILDVGNTKMSNMLNSISHNVSALVLQKPIDGDISNVNWIEHDVSSRLPFGDNTFDIFTSPATLHLIGQGRYGDEQNPYAILNFVEELNRVMKGDSRMYIALPLGKDVLMYSFHFVYSFDTILTIFKNWNLVDYMVDNMCGVGIKKDDSFYQRFDKNTDVSDFKIGDYKIIYLEFVKK